MTELKLIAKDCEFDSSSDDMIRDKLVFRVKNSRTQEKLLSEGRTLTHARAKDICHAIESVQETQAQISAAKHPSPVVKQDTDALKRKSQQPRLQLLWSIKLL